MGKRKGVAAPSAPVGPTELPPGFQLDAPSGAGGDAPSPPDSGEVRNPIQMYSADGTPVTVDASQASAAFQSGQLGFGEGQQVNVRDDRGHIYAIDPQKLDSALASGMQVATDKEAETAIRRKKFNTIGGMVEAGALGAARGLTLGLSDPLAIGAARAIGGEGAAKATREELAGEREFHPVTSTAGEVAGAVAPVLLSGGAAAGAEGAVEGGNLASTAIRTVGVLPRAAAAVGRAAEGLAGRVVGEGATSLLGRVAQRAIPLAAQGAAEGALYGAGGEISEAALGDHELTAEKLLAGAGKGALLGAAGGGLIGSIEAAGKYAAEKGIQLGSKESVQDFFKSFAQERTVKSLGGNATDLRRRGADELRNVADTVLDTHLENGEKLFKPGASVEELGERVNQALDEQNTKLANIKEQIYKVNEGRVELNPDVEGLVKKIDTDILASAKSSPWESVRNKANRVEREIAGLRERITPKIPEEFKQYPPEVLDRLAANNPEIAAQIRPKPIDIRELTNIQKGLDDFLYAKPKGYSGPPPLPPEHMNELVQVRGMIKDSIEQAAENAANASGQPELAKALVDTKRTVHDLILAQQMTERGTNNAIGHRWFSLSDTLAGTGSAAGLIAHGVGGPMAVAGSLASGVAHKFVRERGSSYLAAAADRISKLSAISQAAASVDRQISTGVETLLAETTERGTQSVDRTLRDRKAANTNYEDKAAQLNVSPAEHLAKIQEHVASFAQHAPNIAAAVATKAQTIQQNLQNRLPKPIETGPQIIPGPQKVSPAAIQKYQRYEQGAMRPLSALKDMAAKRLSRDTVDGVRENHPGVYQQMQQTLVQKMADRKSPPSYETRKQIGLFFNIPVESSQTPEFKASIQSVYQPSGNQKPGRSSTGPKRPLNIAKSHQTITDSLRNLGD